MRRPGGKPSPPSKTSPNPGAHGASSLPTQGKAAEQSKIHISKALQGARATEHPGPGGTWEDGSPGAGAQRCQGPHTRSTCRNVQEKAEPWPPQTNSCQGSGGRGCTAGTPGGLLGGEAVWHALWWSLRTLSVVHRDSCGGGGAGAGRALHLLPHSPGNLNCSEEENLF